MKLRLKLRRLNKDHVFFLDETHMRLNAAPMTTLAHPDEQPFVVVEQNSQYAARYDMIGCCSAKEVLPPLIYTPEERKSDEVDGIRTEKVLEYIRDLLAQSIGALDRYPSYLVIDNARVHNKAKMLEAFHENGAENLVDIIFMPAYAAKRLSPLDNCLFAYSICLLEAEGTSTWYVTEKEHCTIYVR